MSRSSNPLFETFRTNLDILALGNRLVNIGGDLSAFYVAHSTYMPYLRFSYISDVPVRLDVEASFDNVTFYVPYTLLGVGGVVMTAYDLMAPRGWSGYVVITFPLVRLRLTVPGAVNTAYLHFFGTLSNVGG